MQDNLLAMLLLILTCVFLAFFVFDYGMRKILKVDREKRSSYYHVNNVHRKIDWGLRIAFSIFIGIVFFYYGNTGKPMQLWPFKPWTVFILFLILSESVRAYMEWKYAENRRTYILTLSGMSFALLMTIIVIQTDFFGLL